MVPPSVTPQSLTSDMFGEAVEVKVGTGSEQKSFTLHRGILRFYSGYFEAALNGKYAEAQKGVIKLPEEEVEVFEQFVFWLYTGKIDRSRPDGDNFRQMCRLWIFADRRQVPSLADYMIDSLRDEIVEKWLVPTAELHFVYENTPPESNLRKFMIWIISSSAVSKVLDGSPTEDWGLEETFDMLRAIWLLKETNSHRLGKAEITHADTCPFHEHEKGGTCLRRRA